jgi:hypothetical protein
VFDKKLNSDAQILRGMGFEMSANTLKINLHFHYFFSICIHDHL